MCISCKVKFIQHTYADWFLAGLLWRLFSYIWLSHFLQCSGFSDCDFRRLQKMTLLLVTASLNAAAAVTANYETIRAPFATQPATDDLV